MSALLLLCVLGLAAAGNPFHKPGGKPTSPLPATARFAPLSGGTVLDETYEVEARVLADALFSPGSPFFKAFAKRVGRSGQRVTDWKKQGKYWERDVTYTAPRSALVRAHQVFEHQSVAAGQNGPGMVVLECAAKTPDVPYGDCFVTRVRFVVTAAEHHNGPATHLRVSWAVEWVGSPPLMRGAILAGARTGIQRNFDAFRDAMERTLNLKPARPPDEAAVGCSPGGGLARVWRRIGYVTGAVTGSLSSWKWLLPRMPWAGGRAGDGGGDGAKKSAGSGARSKPPRGHGREGRDRKKAVSAAAPAFVM